MTGSPFVLSVTQLNTYIRSLFDGDEHLTHVFVSGEISNFTDHYRSGHLYFSLKDERCIVKAVMFAQSAGRLRFRPEDGMRVIVRGRVGVYEASGQYQVYVDDMQPDGLGALNLAYEQLKARLEKEGLFAQERKRPIPRFPHSIGVVTSPTGAAVHDIFSILARRYPLAEVVFCPVQVQGDTAAGQISEAIGRLNRLRCADVIIVGRGGGSLEDLWAFNEERVARAVAASEIPVISAVGHETDFTICDFVADLRAPTPSAAAELAVPDSDELLAAVEALKSRLNLAVNSDLKSRRNRLDSLRNSRGMLGPHEWIAARRIRTDRLLDELLNGAQSRVKFRKARLSELSGRLDTLSPLAVLARGYAIARKEGGTAVPSVKCTSAGETLRLLLRDGELRCTVDQILKEPEENSHESENAV